MNWLLVINWNPKVKLQKRTPVALVPSLVNGYHRGGLIVVPEKRHSIISARSAKPVSVSLTVDRRTRPRRAPRDKQERLSRWSQKSSIIASGLFFYSPRWAATPELRRDPHRKQQDPAFFPFFVWSLSRFEFYF